MRGTETIADIVAEFREMVHKSVDGIIAVKADVIADRIEAAWKRDKSEIEADALNVGAVVATAEKSSAVGNAAAMRETLLRCDAISKLPETRELQSIKDMRNIISVALSLPPRNCDRFKSEKEAAIEFSKRRYNPQPCPDFTFSAWLFSTAEPEAKGESDGK